MSCTDCHFLDASDDEERTDNSDTFCSDTEADSNGYHNEQKLARYDFHDGGVKESDMMTRESDKEESCSESEESGSSSEEYFDDDSDNSSSEEYFDEDSTEDEYHNDTILDRYDNVVELPESEFDGFKKVYGDTEMMKKRWTDVDNFSAEGRSHIDGREIKIAGLSRAYGATTLKEFFQVPSIIRIWAGRSKGRLEKRFIEDMRRTRI